MQTKQKIQQLLASAGVSPNKRFGQHFLIDLNLMNMLVDSAHIHSNDVVLEVGCGTGSLTESLVEKAGYVVAVEVDEILAQIARNQLAKAQNVKIVNADVLESKHKINQNVATALNRSCNQYTGRLLLIANLPYGVASPVMLNLITGPIVADAMYVTVQKEVVERMAASPGGKEYGTLSILLAATGTVKTIRNLGPSVFWPQPQVDSAIVSFIRSREKIERIRNMGVFRKVVALFMQHRRKMLMSCTKFAEDELAKVHGWHLIFDECAIDHRKRPENLTADEYLAIANICSEQLS
jgi:16S rRNA (adenine1518-N6/adenine1519-N6)-dimethyltransferase